MKNDNFPKVYGAEITKKIDNSQEYAKVDERKIEKLSKGELDKKINNIFKSDNYIYKIKVNIVTKKGLLEKNLVGKNELGLITIDNEIINYEEIEDIYLK